MPRLSVFTLAFLWLLASSTSSAQEVWTTPGAPGAVDVSSTPVVLEPVAPDTYEAAVLLGTRQIVLRDFESALKGLRAAATRDASRPEAFCHLGDAQLAQGDIPEARAAYESCQRFATTEKNVRYVALSLVGLARTFEHEKKPKEERDVWQRAATETTDEAARALAQARISVLNFIIEQEAAYVAVRARIAEAASKATAKP